VQSERHVGAQKIGAESVAVGVLSKITVPLVRLGRSRVDARDPRWVVHHHAPTADPTTPARIPRVRLLK
jgi:hypothetical protein